jgi:phenylpropionate dioxygenase-like ring-hydroxylating dioxygenase large terminal subunit
MIDDPLLVNDWHPVARSEQVADQGMLATRLLGEDLVIWRAGAELLAWQDLCIHRGARLSLGRITDSTLRCPYHGWVYGSSGRCVHIPAHPEQTPPAKAVVRSYHARERYGLIWVCLGEPSGDIPPFPEWGAPGFGSAVCGPFPHIHAHGPRLIENYLDAAHFPFVHGGVLGDPAQPELGEFEVRIGPDGVESDPISVYQPDPYGGTAGRVTYTYHAYRPLTAHFTKHMPSATNGMVLTITPHDQLDSTAWFLVATTAVQDHRQLEEHYTPRIAAIFEEDRAIVESQRPELLPLDLQAELHLRSDRVAVAYRRWLRQLGLRYGIA